jgi:dTDP-4-dehydrorhamnose 3,5-epimerase
MTSPPTRLPGVWLIESELRTDTRGFLLRTYDEQELSAHGLNTHWPQHNLTLTEKRGQLRGLHFQADPHPETKLIRCVSGKIFDVLVNVQPDSPAYGQWQSFELSADRPQALYVPGGYAHGLQALTDHCLVHYLMSDVYVPDLNRGYRWNDPTLNIPWPLEPLDLSERDATLPLLPPKNNLR